MELSMQAYVWGRNLAAEMIDRLVRDEAGEGVISTAIAVLIMAALGALMWVGFKAIWGNASSKTTTQINTIGS
ncbi:MAG: DUF6133 family protein [Actinomycetota bacterium]|nr:DUF6133 family protein [Actinomycetota bacterium]